MASEDTDDQLSEASSSSGLLCIHCNEDEVKWACNECSREFCDRCKRIHLIADEETRDHHLYRYGSKHGSGPNVPDVIHHSALSVNEARRPRVKFKPVVESRVSEFKPKTSLVENSTVQHIRIVPRGNGDAWLKCGAISEELVSHDAEGNYLQRIRADSVIQDFVVTSKREIIFSKIHSKALWIHTNKGQIKPMLQLEFFPNCLYLTAGNDLLICALSTQQCRGSPLIKLSRSSQKSVIQVDQGLNLGDVYDMSQSANDTICLVEKGGWGPGRIVGLDQDGGRVFEYRGPSGSLNPSGIACDGLGFIYVSDCGCHNVHVKRHRKSRSLSHERAPAQKRSRSPQPRIKQEPPWTPPRDKRERRRDRSVDRGLGEREERSHVKREREEDRDFRHNERVRVKQERQDRHDRPHRQREDQQRERRQNDDRRRQNHRQRGNNPFRTTEEDGLEFGRPSDSNDKNKGKPVEKEKPNFSTSGKLAEDTNIYRGVVIKYNQPPEARKPKTRWRLYPFKGDEALPVLHIHRQSAYLIGRDRIVVDIPVDHPSCSKQHAVLQFRLVEFQREDGSTGRRVRPYIIDLGSSNGTFVNNKKIDPERYVELLEKDMIKFGFSSREYVILHEKSDTSELEDQGVISD